MKEIADNSSQSLRLVCHTLRFNRGQIYYRNKEIDLRCTPRMDDEPVLEKIKEVIKDRATYGYRRVSAMLRKRIGMFINKKRVYRIMKRFGLLLKRKRRSRRIHWGRIATVQINKRWCTDITGIVSWNGEKGRFAFILDCCNREVLSWRFQRHLQWVDIALMLDEAIDNRLGDTPLAAKGIELLHDNGPEFTANAFKDYVEKDLGMIDCCTPVHSPESNGMAESFIGTFKRDYVYENILEDFETVKRMIPGWIDDYNCVAPHSALGMKSPREFLNIVAA